jgi:cytidine deaminase
MRTEQINLEFEVYETSDELSEKDKELLKAARNITSKAYAPYSNFSVGAVAILNNGETVSGTNQENASYPVGTCAERVLLGTASMMHTNVPIETIAISYHNANGDSNKPISPCGMCRQTLKEYEERTDQPMRVIMAGLTGKVYILRSASFLLPLSFGSVDLK